MTWIAPVVVPTAAPRPADERASLDGWLDFHREVLLAKCSGLTGEQLVRRPVASSDLSLLGLVRHLAEVERIWFQYRFAGEDVGPLYQADDGSDGAFVSADPATAEADFATFAAEIEACRRTTAGRPLDEAFTFGQRHTPCDLRWVYVHLIEEYARHNGHADLIRELVDGSTG
ncbi:DinB family protein [Longispora sp. K20-0274]|uniref:DinB family protein n=1 Tax=Longispora sp. K20-0274 TaxID=3088255 RepID=UPI00399B910F